MARSQRGRSHRPDPEHHLHDVTVHSHRRVNKFFTPTHVRFSDLSRTASRPFSAEWSSRKARKRRYANVPARVHWIAKPGRPLSRTPSRRSEPSGGTGAGEASEQGGGVGAVRSKDGMMEFEIVGRVRRIESEFKPGLSMDISFWVAVSFTFGSMVWVVNGFTVWFPILRPELDTTAFTYTSAALAFIGGTVFEIGSYLMVVEALDRGREISFGTAFGELLHVRRGISNKHSSALLQETEDKLKSLESSLSPPTGDATPTPTNGSGGDGTVEEKKGSGTVEKKQWIWWGKPMWHDLGYCAAIIQLFAATIFWISTLTGLPGVIPGFIDSSGSKPIVDVFFWTPQVIGGMGFVTSSLILMLEVQHRWWKIRPWDIGWQVGFWNLIGAIGFALCGALGYSSSSACEYQSALSTFWGSWAFLIGSGFQVWEVIWREPDPKSEGGSGKGE